MHPWARAAFLVYVIGAVLVGETFPFSRFDMYADVADRASGAVPVFLADGAPAEPTAFRAFHGLAPETLRPPAGIACSLGYVVAEREAWVATHPAATAGPVRIEVGFDLVRLEGGVVVHDVRVTGRGTAWP